MSELGLASRREADEWIARGWVRVDGRVVAELGSRVLPSQRITIDAARAQRSRRSSSRCCSTSRSATSAARPRTATSRRVVLVTPRSPVARGPLGHPLPARAPERASSRRGRLDIDSVGLLVLTQDGRVAQPADRRGQRRSRRSTSCASQTRGGRAAARRSAGAAAPRPRARRRGAAPGAGRMGQRRPAALRAAGRQEAPDPAHVRGGRPAGARPQARAHRRGRARRTAAGAVALPARSTSASSPAPAPARWCRLMWPPNRPSRPMMIRIDRDDEVEQARHDQDEDAGDQGDERADGEG